MLGRTMKSMRRRLGPVGLSVAAAALTATAFAAVSVAADDPKKGEEDNEAARGPVIHHEFGPMADLSAEDREKLESFRQCMEDEGAPGPPAPPKPGDRDEGELHRLDPPSEAEREKIEKALEACEDKLPEGLPGPPGCGPGGRGDPDGPGGREGAVIPGPDGESQSGAEQGTESSSS